MPTRLPVLRSWSDLREREVSVQIRPGDPVLLAPDYRVDELMTLYFSSQPFAGRDPMENSRPLNTQDH
ncbi:hypothetical protein [Streptomyces chiangmaiensis]|uniref:Uncharacterized protein n=1 Tax=Streptomyces chiangmaiensis TaxID=766497 RepID=A0ABU7FW65_9ACTN|nr:hypothetical protein [Streptomyces chiangmaiensis]MED7828038.1 hypothetical protein [Streptomyces chiangmaiensis]